MSWDNIDRMHLINNRDGTFWCQAVHVDGSVLHEVARCEDTVQFIEDALGLLMHRLIAPETRIEVTDALIAQEREADQARAQRAPRHLRPNSRPPPQKRRTQ